MYKQGKFSCQGPSYSSVSDYSKHMPNLLILTLQLLLLHVLH